ncbi:hypothetical protein PG997_002667 [Apiospora hydei]|uniref:Condensation domain-containing protein n=1 Tax=Apiospora hydei TaxID=1337664 RepID=A0ABR1WX32_9PEZI
MGRQDGMLLTVADVIRCRTIAELAKVVSPLPTDTNKPSCKPKQLVGSTPNPQGVDDGYFNGARDAVATDIESVISCSPMQESLLLSQVKEDGQYECSFTFRLSAQDTLDCQQIADAWQGVVNRHSILRTYCRESTSRPGAFEQVILRKFQVGPTMFDFRNMPIDASAVLKGHKTTRRHDQPPHAMTICHRSDEEFLIKLDISHLIFDGYSMRILMGDLISAISNSLPDSVAASYSTYLDFLEESDWSESLVFWKKCLSDLDPCTLPQTTTYKDADEANKALVYTRQSMPDYGELREFASKHDVTVAAVLQFAWALVLSRLLNRHDVVFGVLTSGREAPVDDVEQIVGPLINVLPCQCDVSSDLSVRDAINSVQEDVLSALSHQYVHLGEIQHALGSSQPIFSTAISILPASNVSNSSTGLQIEMIDQYQPTEFDLTLNFSITETMLTLDLGHWNNRMSQAQADSILATYSQAIQSIMGSPKMQIGHLDVLSSRDRSQIMKWAEASMEQPVEHTMHQLISTKAYESPESEAVSSWDGTFTYRQVEELSDLLALELLGTHPDLERGSFIAI